MSSNILYMDGFDHYGTSNAAASSGIWTSLPGTIGVPTWGPARTGPYAYKGSAGNYATLSLTSAPTSATTAFGIALDTYTPGLRDFYAVRFPGTVANVDVRVNTTGAVTVVRNDVLIATSAPGLITAQRWYFMQVVVSATNVDVYLDNTDGTGTPIVSTAITNMGTWSTPSFAQPQSGAGGAISGWIDDLIVYDGDRHSVGDRRVGTLSLLADDTTYNNWTPFYNKKFGTGIARLAYLLPSNSAVQNTSAAIYTAKSSSMDIKSNDFTYETFAKFHSTPTTSGYATIFGRWDSTNNERSFRLIYGGPSFNTSSLQFDICTDGTAGTVSTKIVYPWTPDLNRWYHIAIVRVSGELLLFVDGQQLGLPSASSETYYFGGASVNVIGNSLSGFSAVPSTYFSGNFDESRFTNGVGRYTSTFTPPSAAFPRDATDPYWTSVVWLMGYDNGVVDESSYVRTVIAAGAATSFIVNDGPDIGVYSTIDDVSPDDHNGISAPLVSAIGTLTMTVQPSNGDTVTVGTTDGVTPAVYTFKTTVTTAYDVLIDTTAQGTLLNLMNAINLGTGIGTKYGTGTLINVDVTMTQLPAGQLLATANIAGTTGNAIASTATGTSAMWGGSTLSGGLDIPGASRFRFSRPAIKTTVIDAIQLVTRASKSDSGTGSIQAGLVGEAGGVVLGTVRPLAISSNYYNDIIDTDPDTSGDITPSTLINGLYQINRTA